MMEGGLARTVVPLPRAVPTPLQAGCLRRQRQMFLDSQAWMNRPGTCNLTWEARGVNPPHIPFLPALPVSMDRAAASQHLAAWEHGPAMAPPRTNGSRIWERKIPTAPRKASMAQGSRLTSQAPGVLLSLLLKPLRCKSPLHLLHLPQHQPLACCSLFSANFLVFPHGVLV